MRQKGKTPKQKYVSSQLKYVVRPLGVILVNYHVLYLKIINKLSSCNFCGRANIVTVLCVVWIHFPEHVC